MIAAVSIETVLIFDVPVLITTLGTLGIALLGLKSQQRVEPKVHAIDDAVNNTPDGAPTIKDNVQALVDGDKP
jgi:hypothetical protein